MKTKTAFILFMFGLILTMLGVGGVENSIETADLLLSVAVAGLGLLTMYAGTVGVRNGSYYD